MRRRGRREPQNNGSDNGPLRLILGKTVIGCAPVEVLACGHLQAPDQNVAATRRRCKKCRRFAPLDVNPNAYQEEKELKPTPSALVQATVWVLQTGRSAGVVLGVFTAREQAEYAARQHLKTVDPRGVCLCLEQSEGATVYGVGEGSAALTARAVVLNQMHIKGEIVDV